jgi:predicted DNA-binding transcriptional regulator AlpA
LEFAVLPKDKSNDEMLTTREVVWLAGYCRHESGYLVAERCLHHHMEQGRFPRPDVSGYRKGKPSLWKYATFQKWKDEGGRPTGWWYVSAETERRRNSRPLIAIDLVDREEFMRLIGYTSVSKFLRHVRERRLPGRYVCPHDDDELRKWWWRRRDVERCISTMVPVRPRLPGGYRTNAKASTLMSRSAVLAKTGLSPTQLRRLVRRGLFPRPIDEGEGVPSWWLKKEVIAWVTERDDTRGAMQAA